MLTTLLDYNEYICVVQIILSLDLELNNTFISNCNRNRCHGNKYHIMSNNVLFKAPLVVMRFYFVLSVRQQI